MSKKLICLTTVGLMLAIAGSAGAQLGKGKVLYEYWENIGSGTAITDLTGNANYPNKPTSSEWRDSFKGPVNRSDNAGMRARAYLTAPADGDYTFYIATDDAGQLWLSTDDKAANAKQIAFVAGWAGTEEWQNANEKANQKSAPIKLQANKVYYIEALEKEGGGGDNLDVGWSGPTIGDAPVVIAGKFLSAFVRSPEPLLKATSPNPANNAVEITNPLLQWTAGVTAVMHKVYVGTSTDLGPATFIGPWPTPMAFVVTGLTPGVKYYWRVDEVDAAGVETTGDVWSFTVQPLEAHNPDPIDGMAGRALSVTLKWVAGQGAINHQVYLGADKAKVAASDASVAVAKVPAATLSYSATGLTALTTYYWKVDELDAAGKVLAAGPVWSFATIDPAGGAMAEFWNAADLNFYNMDLLGPAAVVKKVNNVDTSWPDGATKGTNSPDPNVNTNYFFGRYTATLVVPTSGQYTLIESSDDGGMLYLDGVPIAGQWATGGEAEFASTPMDLVAGQKYLLTYEYFEATGGAAARIRWSGPGITKQAIWQGALMPPTCAFGPTPRSGAAEIADSITLSWNAPAGAIAHTVYFGTDKAKVTAGDKSVAQAPSLVAKFAPASALTWNTTYYWKVDEMSADGTTVPGQVWSFTTANFIPVQMAQASLSYNNAVAPFMSSLAFNVPADLTKNSVTDLALRFQGAAAPTAANAACGVTYNDANGVYKVAGNGTDIWNTSDQFEYAYKALTGDGSMIARVVSIGPGTNTWAKGGVMIRQSLNGNSMYAATSITPDSTGNGGNGGCFQWRPSTGGSAAGAANPTPAVGAPYWVKIERKGNVFQGFLSPDGKTWTSLKDSTGKDATQTIPMTDPVFIGLAVTSHVDWASAPRVVTFDNVSTTGDVTAGAFTTAKNVTQGNDKLPLYVAIEDKAGKMAVVNNANPAAVNTTVFDLWRVPMSSFTGVDLKNAVKLYVGVGDGATAGSGTINVADVRIVKAVTLPAAGATDVTAKGDVLKGFPDYAGAWPAAEVPANAIDNSNSKYLSFSNSGGTGGKTTMPCGFAVTPSLGATVVTGLTFTAANDAADRDPINWELYGSNKSIDGPWALIARGTVDDFSRGSRERLGTNLDWPRNWKTVTPIGFANVMPYTNYKVQFTSVKRALTANSMQIAEVELLGVAAPAGKVVVWVSFSGNENAPSSGAAGNGFTVAVDKGYTDMLKANGYNVVRYVQTATPNVDMLNAADLVIASRNCASTSFQNAAADLWNSVKAPMIITNGYLSRKARLGFNVASDVQDITGDVKLTVADAKHPIFAGIALGADGTMVNPYVGLAIYPTDKTAAAGLSVVNDAIITGGTLLAGMSAVSGNVKAGAPVIAEWPAGASVVHDGGAGTNVLGGHRLVILTGSRENNGKSSETAGMYDLSADGAKMFLNAVAYMLQ